MSYARLRSALCFITSHAAITHDMPAQHIQGYFGETMVLTIAHPTVVVFFSSQSDRLRATGWRAGVLLKALLGAVNQEQI
jgi:hypothetical protein